MTKLKLFGGDAQKCHLNIKTTAKYYFYFSFVILKTKLVVCQLHLWSHFKGALNISNL